jgi:hypothetical protein
MYNYKRGSYIFIVKSEARIVINFIRILAVISRLVYLIRGCKISVLLLRL